MLLYGIVFVVSLLVVVAITPPVRWGARRLDAMDKPDGFRKIQKRAIPRLGGIAVYGGFFAALLAGAQLQGKWAFASLPVVSHDVAALLLGATGVVLIGAWDDVRNLRARWKLVALTGISVAMYAAGYRIDAISTPFGSSWHIGFLALPVTVFWFLGCMNAINLIDGLDGLAAGVCVLAATTVFVASLMFGHTMAALLSAALIGASLGFLVFNFNPASIYLGDSGSYLLGFLIASIGLRGAAKSSTVVALAIPVIALGLPVMDTALAVLRRWSKALPLSTGDRGHIHHKLLDAGFTQRQVVLMMYVACIVLGSFALLLTATKNVKAGGLLLVLGVAIVAAVRVIGRSEINMTKKRLKSYLQGRKSARKGLRASRASGGDEPLPRAEHAEPIWATFTHARDETEVELGEGGPADANEKITKRHREEL